jgi:hypothetical protein
VFAAGGTAQFARQDDGSYRGAKLIGSNGIFRE